MTDDFDIDKLRLRANIVVSHRVVEPRKLANGMLEIDGISRWSKWRALPELERRGLVVIDRRRRRSPIVTLNLLQ